MTHSSKLITAAFLFALFSTWLPKSALAVTPDCLIVPGQSVGHISLGDEPKELASFGKPTRGDGAMMHEWSTWLSKSPRKPASELDVYSRMREGGDMPVIDEIRVTSTYFSTANGVSTGTRLSRILAKFPKARLSGAYTLKSRQEKVRIYDSVGQGIAFEVIGSNVKQTCVAIDVHSRGRMTGKEYPDLAGYLNE